MTEPQGIQPIGFHLGLSSDWLVNAVSANVSDFLPGSPSDFLGQPLTAALCDDAIHDVRNRMALLRNDDTIEHLFHASLVSQGKPFDLSIYRDGDEFGIDAEPSDGHAFGDATGVVEGMLARLEAANDVESLCTEAARQLRALTGFDRALITGEGKLLGQSARVGPEQPVPIAPDSVRGDLAVVDCNADPVAILRHGEVARSLSRSTLRFPTDEETATMASIGARAALIVPLIRDGKAWGHVGCYNGAPRHIGAERRSVARLFTRIIGLRIEIAELRRRG